MKKRTGKCNKCGQCCGADGGHGWPKNWFIILEQYTKEELNEYLPVIGLIGIPRDTGVASGTVTIDGKDYEYEWATGEKLRKPGTEEQCPFLYKKKKKWYCALVKSSEEWRWEKQCKNWPSTYSSSIKKNYPKCSYKFT